jgi:hypothetical protein
MVELTECGDVSTTTITELEKDVCREIYRLGIGIRTQNNDKYFQVINELELCSMERYRWVLRTLSTGTGTNRDTLLLLGLVYTPNFYIDVVFPVEILRDIKFLSENLWSLINYFTDDTCIHPIPYNKCTPTLESSQEELVRRVESMEKLTDNNLEVLLLDIGNLMLGVLHNYNMLSQLTKIL